MSIRHEQFSLFRVSNCDDDIVEYDFPNCANLTNYDSEQAVRYGWDQTADFRFNMKGVLVQAQNPEVVLRSKRVNGKTGQPDRMRLEVMRSTGRLRRLSGLTD